METPKQTPIEDLMIQALKDYQEASDSVYSFNSDIPKAIKYYFNSLQNGFVCDLKEVKHCYIFNKLNDCTKCAYK